MICAWKELLSILPPYLRPDVDGLGKGQAQEIRLRVGKLPVIHLGNRCVSFGKPTTADELNFVVNTASRYSPWASASAAKGYVTALGGHRIGICGEAVVKEGNMTGFRVIRSLNIRIARDFPGIAAPISTMEGNVLILGKPGSGKTTLLRDLVRQRSKRENVCVVDERGELFPLGMDTGQAVDILTGCGKGQGIDIVLRTMGPNTVAVDEITEESDCESLWKAGWCGVNLLATLHGANKEDLYHRRIYRPLVEKGLFETVVIMRPDKTYYTERMKR